MAGKNSKQRTHGKSVGLVMGGAVGAFVAAAAVATGSAAPAKADFEDLLDPIIQPLLTSFTDSIAAFDPSAAADITSWTDSLLSSLGNFDVATSGSDSAVAAAASAAASPVTGTYDLPLTLLGTSGQPLTEPAVTASIDGGGSVPLLVDTGSSGLVVPYTDLGSNYFSQLEALFNLGFPTGISESSYSGGVDYYYLTYSDVPVSYTGGLETNGPVDIEVYSFNPSDPSSYFTNDAFQDFLSSNDVNGILGIGDNALGPTTSPFISYGGVLVDVPGKSLIVGGDAPTGGVTVSGAPISQLYEAVNSGTPQLLYNNVDSGGVNGTIPATLVPASSVGSDGNVADGTVISVYDKVNGVYVPLYSYTVGDNDVPGGDIPGPTVESGIGTSSTNFIDSGVEPFIQEPIYLSYTDGTMTFYPAGIS